MDSDVNLNKSGDLPDGTDAANAGGSNGSLNIVNASDEDEGSETEAYFGPERNPAKPLGHDWPVHEVKATGVVLKDGYAVIDVDAIGPFDIDDSGGEERVGDPLTQGGFLGRPRGTAR